MSKAKQAVEVKQVPQKEVSQQVPLLVVYHNQLANFTKQRDEVKAQFHQLEGAIFACQQMINQYQDSAKQGIDQLKKNMGEQKNGKANSEEAKQVAKK